MDRRKYTAVRIDPGLHARFRAAVAAEAVDRPGLDMKTKAEELLLAYIVRSEAAKS